MNISVQVSELLKSNNDYSEDFARLKAIYEVYAKEKVRIQSRNQFKTRIFQTLPLAFIGLFGIILGYKELINETLFVFSLILTICAPTLGVFLGARQAAKIPGILHELSNQFKIDYVCPKCGSFLGEVPWESLSNKKQCPISTCKAKWIRT